MAAQYKPARGAQYGIKQAQALGHVLENLGEHVTPEQVVDAARPAKSPIHSMFEWNDTAAAEQHRLWQARQHISHLEIVVRTESGDLETRAYHSVVIVTGDDKQRGYSHMVDIRKSTDLSDQVIAKAFRELEGWKERYAEYKSLFGSVFAAIDKVAPKGKQAKKPKRMAAVA
jgi:hypothetical protein